ncbi:MAG: ribosomal protein L11 methyltransferase [Bacillota bacterium]|nr:MAG: ribosomal protein L11 methyltransferase [Bacillota bacterium]MBS3951211.1 50S ribosomal protein L11 methyltransferase [Peptococcaceae bacterium]
MKWTEITVITSQEAKEAVTDILYRAGATGVVIVDATSVLLADDVEDYSPAPPPDIPLEEVRVTAYLSIEQSLPAIIDGVRLEVAALVDYDLDPGRGEVILAEVEDEDWATAWKQYYKPVLIGPRVVIKPSWEALDYDTDKVVVELDPGMAFGTGTHPTTVMCLEYLQEYTLENKKVLDLGCGSGILSIAAAKLGAKEVLALDYDPVAVKVAAQNVQHNGIDAVVTVRESNLFAVVQGEYDVVVANIIARIIIEAMPAVKAHLSPCGIFIASGIIQEKLGGVLAAMVEHNLRVIEQRTQGEWVALVVTHKGQ